MNGPDGNVVYQRELEHDIIREGVEAGEELGLTILAYATDRILVPHINKATDRLVAYKEPVPEEVPDFKALIGDGVCVPWEHLAASNARLVCMNRPGSSALCNGS